jgi:choloylglycine hydrolase
VIRLRNIVDWAKVEPMCTDMRFVRIGQHVSARTLDFVYELNSRVQVVPRGQQWSAVPTGTGAAALRWTNDLGFVGIDGFGFDSFFGDGLNEAGLSVGTLWLPETDLTQDPPDGPGPSAMDFPSIAGWLLGTCRTVADVKSALDAVRIWNASMGRIWPGDRPMPAEMAPMKGAVLTEHLSIHDAHGGDIVVEFLDGTMHIHDNPIGVLTNAPRFEWHRTNLRNYLGLTTVERMTYNLNGMEVTPTGNGTGLVGLPGDVTPPSRFVRATMLTEVVTSIADHQAAVNQAFHSLELVSVPRFVTASGDYTQWRVVRDHDNLVLYTRTHDGWGTGVHDLEALGVRQPGPRSVRALVPNI